MSVCCWRTLLRYLCWIQGYCRRAIIIVTCWPNSFVSGRFKKGGESCTRLQLAIQAQGAQVHEVYANRQAWNGVAIMVASTAWTMVWPLFHALSRIIHTWGWHFNGVSWWLAQITSQIDKYKIDLSTHEYPSSYQTPSYGTISSCTRTR